jgi:hypothetical protein
LNRVTLGFNRSFAERRHRNHALSRDRNLARHKCRIGRRQFDNRR